MLHASLNFSSTRRLLKQSLHPLRGLNISSHVSKRSNLTCSLFTIIKYLNDIRGLDSSPFSASGGHTVSLGSKSNVPLIFSERPYFPYKNILADFYSCLWQIFLDKTAIPNAALLRLDPQAAFIFWDVCISYSVLTQSHGQEQFS